MKRVSALFSHTAGPHPIKVIYEKPSAAKTGSQPPPKYQAPSGTSKVQVRAQSLKVKAQEPEAPPKEAEPEKKQAVLKKVLRPKSAQAESQPKPPKKAATAKPVAVEEPVKPQVEIPFAENRLKGQFPSLTKDLYKKAQEALMKEKADEARKKEEEAMRKEKLRLIEETIKREN